ncbi:copper amine oxidase N-terminal domain-containing protein [Desulfallas thermosapovorans]|uniref:Copper amine oxidase-like protein n=1 Tax=Desulfallas thermosapovorans DSM 6562 TaxID=1121431 RepID=A0A5S4ZV68_9FIRM|nr:copper amine oxidase N-terminal domain-containing protein [Desulfallas thermosapovorans]TYO96611.1 copper amine oxidase-like protein [Desulfallas thermosapovorans DSM 6562]
MLAVTALGQEVEWDAEDKSITSGGIWLQVNNPVATVDGENVNLAVPAKIINNVTYVPLQFIAVSLNKDVAFDSEQNRIDITDEPVVDEEVDEEAVADEDVATDEDADVDEDAAAEEEADAEEVVEE